MTSEEKYRVVFDSKEIERRYRRRAKRGMAKKFRLSRKKVNLLFSFKRITIKKYITFQEAVRLQLAVEQTGGICEIRPMVRKAMQQLASANQKITQTVPLPDNNKMVSSWYDHVTETFVETEEPHYVDPKVYRYGRKVADRRLVQDRRLAIRMEIERRGADDRREENRIWEGNWKK